jgi:superfamily II RNA helicase
MTRTYQGFALDPFQEQAIEAIERHENVIVAAPTGCGKTLVAEFAIERALERGERVVYTAPVKALSNQKFRDFGARHGARIGIMTGDVTINPTADAMIMTTEIFRNTIFDNPAKLAGIRYVILDEAHYLDDAERGTVWEESIIFAPPEIRFIALSATISNLSQLAAWVRKVREGGTTVVLEEHRPVPLRMHVFTGEHLFELDRMPARRFPLPGEEMERRHAARARPSTHGAFGRGARGRHLEEPAAEAAPAHGLRGGRGGGWRGREGGGRGRPRASSISPVQRSFRLLDRLTERDHLPCIFFLFSRELCEQMAFACMNRELLDLDEKERVAALWDSLVRDFDLSRSPAAERLGKIVRRGIAFHHAGMLPTLKEVVERLFTSGLVKLLFATETFALGVNMPARAVAFETLKKFDGVKRDYMKTREFFQMAGRAGRRGKDREGYVYACVDAEQESPPDVHGVMTGEVEPVESQFNLAYATLLQLWSHLGEGIYTACERSFVHFRSRGRKGTPYQDMVQQVKRRLLLLEDEGYLRGRALTGKGKLASVIYGFEIQAAELFEGGFLESLDAHSLAVLCVSLVFEAKREGWFVPLAREKLEPIRRAARDRIARFRAREEAYRISQETKLPDWNLARATWEWTHGAPFESLREWADVSPGDLVRAFRLGIQLLRQLAKPLRFVDHDTSRLRETIREATRLVKRGEVDAERSLRQAIRSEAGDEAAARIPPELDVAEESVEGDVTLDHVAAAEAGPGRDGAGPGIGPKDGRPERGPVDASPESGPADARREREPEDARAGGGPEGSRAERAPPSSPRPRASDFGWLPADEVGTEGASGVRGGAVAATPRRGGGTAQGGNGAGEGDPDVADPNLEADWPEALRSRSGGGAGGGRGGGRQGGGGQRRGGRGRSGRGRGGRQGRGGGGYGRGRGPRRGRGGR